MEQSLLSDTITLSLHYKRRAKHYRTQSENPPNHASELQIQFDAARASYCDQIANDLDTLIQKHERKHQNAV